MNKNKRPYGHGTLKSQFSELEMIDELSKLILGNMSEWELSKHSRRSALEIELLNSLEVHSCPFCQSADIVKDGYQKDGTRRYRCKSCGRRFSPLTGTLLDSHKISLAEWIEFCIHLFQFQSLNVSSIDNRNAYSTGRYWLKKIFLCIEKYQDAIILERKAFVDETYLSVMPKGLDMKDGKKLRGLSRNKLCIATATDGNRTFIAYIGNGKPSAKRLIEGLGNHIKPGTLIVDDGEKSHASLCRKLNSERESHPGSPTKGLPDDRNPLDPVNKVHRFFKRFMRNHGGYKRDKVQDWCNLFSFIWNHHGKLPKMVYDVMQLVLNHKKILRYRELFAKKS